MPASKDGAKKRNIYIWHNDVIDQCYDWSRIMAALPLCSFFRCHSLCLTADPGELAAWRWFCRRLSPQRAKPVAAQNISSFLKCTGK